MERITKYRATDGTEWTTVEDCVNRDRLDHKVRGLENALGPAVGYGRRQIDSALVTRVKDAVVDLCRSEFPNEPVFQEVAARIHPNSYAGRFLSDVGGPLQRIWFRFACINGEWEYEQPYFALHPEAFKDGQ